MSEITPKQIERMIYVIRCQKVMLDSDLAQLYGVETKILKRSVRRNIGRFPDDFMFELSKKELEDWRYQFGTSNKHIMGLRIRPFAFTEQGIAMLSSILRSDQAVAVNISIIRTFVKMRNLLASDESLVDRVSMLEEGTDRLFKVVFERLDTIERKVPLLPRDRNKIRLK